MLRRCSTALAGFAPVAWSSSWAHPQLRYAELDAIVSQDPASHTPMPPPPSLPPVDEPAAALPDSAHPLRRFAPPDEAAAALRSLFCIDSKWGTFINHGAFGGVATPLAKVAAAWEAHASSQPLAFFDRELFGRLGDATHALASFVGASPQDLVLVPNPTTAINALAAATASASPGAPILVLSSVYASTPKIARALTGTEPLVVDIPLPSLHPSFVAAAVSAAMDAAPTRPAAAIIDHVASNSALVAPLDELAAVFARHDVPLVVDGAHGLLAQDLTLTPDACLSHWYVGSCHKWFSAPRGVGFLWANPERVSEEARDAVLPPVISHGYTGPQATLHAKFGWDGTRSYAPALTLPYAVALWEALGVDAVRQHMHGLLRAASELLSAEWGTGVLDPPAVHNGTSLATVELPQAVVGHKVVTGGRDDVPIGVLADVLQDWLFHEHNIEVPVKSRDGKLYVRISAHIYNTMDDYTRLASAVRTLLPSIHAFRLQ
ncbi:selenocysteine lyase/isopenicillin N epimerase [Thecamonas trahens ATCC 50062]|uniref:Selenocysteine lyase/isopenicillin N epimerase n=1 Tax=Thecamonas trahens ATCC 50062 TaxID=461836 RepID=A0A0L0D874_THETB|nr:selenocysteine lyase/isopenicillin N epimerase [Thecamonas trahens ATCC 50062]KNC48271.1 selenocysteine lyase/isopenicillin N epimerase [Thecamonas trahens ATCC 50062]|eukprot:XP_013758838.1 selenocysteine lyase/isopenicillin N epimerase [Thecamonas trahens ATCC 50062]